jgi:hypothetical protein
MSQWWLLFVLGFGVGLAFQIAFLVLATGFKWLPSSLWPIRQAKGVISNMWRGSATLLMSAILGAVTCFGTILTPA